MSFDAEWVTFGKHRTRLRATRGFPTATLRTLAEVAKLAIENNMSARARLVEVLLRDEDGSFEITVATTVEQDLASAAPIEVALSTVFGLPADKVTLSIERLSEQEVELRFGVYERLLAQKTGTVPPIQ
ncbi:hypothetical protein J2797_003900 [Paraburkholderia terricola]|jgi:hypothetical protein|uniref:Uncharacterized protein n=1 Tax=Paraburkholderia terricola TaxID=169427 RepID=A0A1M6VC83_9BURK|nr:MULTISPECIES: hypothetical protein [Paraburkholderia]ORC49555.1 hypothetical protein B2G74_16350 [Burkholderia sp. A27]AXE92483.1 hypothetical protein CUJ90_09065 [Paraburkholderia terricola]MDR6449096.1 hypothetical protein [Paraburkholderia terricola]MDR6493997.1 hypothetical protein [Paraburkholderia terricola]SDP02362.1 hypothetical protein SAMN05192547_103738 [Paraburkholderia sediminicola]